MHPLNTVKGAITTGVVLAVIIGIGLACWMSNTAGFHGASLDRAALLFQPGADAGARRRGGR
jgi:hypothetical protein